MVLHHEIIAQHRDRGWSVERRQRCLQQQEVEKEQVHESASGHSQPVAAAMTMTASGEKSSCRDSRIAPAAKTTVRTAFPGRIAGLRSNHEPATMIPTTDASAPEAAARPMTFACAAWYSSVNNTTMIDGGTEAQSRAVSTPLHRRSFHPRPAYIANILVPGVTRARV